ncbi:MAG: (2Fe-2S)-binding protein [Bacteroidetes bacterium]|jgi:carbon-monoxide dehydrogenase small subunit|nr:(2Fe-2S)-binding protein [Bacteroidota bacterium]
MTEHKKEEERIEVRFTLNGQDVDCTIAPMQMLLHLLRDHFLLKGTKPGCEEGECGACTILVNDMPVNACLYLAANAEGKRVWTIEGLGNGQDGLDEVQKQLVAHGAVQCGFCSPGMAMAIKGMQLFQQRTQQVLDRAAIQKWLEGNLCRCTGYVHIVDAAERLLQQNHG